MGIVLSDELLGIFMNTKPSQPRVLTEGEIEMYLKGEHREINRLILLTLNDIAICFAHHTTEQDKVTSELEHVGGIQGIKERAAFVNSLIAKNRVRTAMMEKVSQSSLTWALLAFLGFIAAASWEAIVHAIRAKLGS